MSDAEQHHDTMRFPQFSEADELELMIADVLFAPHATTLSDQVRAIAAKLLDRIWNFDMSKAPHDRPVQIVFETVSKPIKSRQSIGHWLPGDVWTLGRGNGHEICVANARCIAWRLPEPIPTRRDVIPE